MISSPRRSLFRGFLINVSTHAVLTANIGNYDRSIPTIPHDKKNVYLVNFQGSDRHLDDVSMSGNSLSFSIQVIGNCERAV